MDGINGISAAQLIIAGLTWITIGTLEDLSILQGVGAVTVGTAAGFFPWSFPTARFFTGDAGSYFAGGWLAAGSILAVRLSVPVPAVIAPLMVYGVDTTLTLVHKTRVGLGWQEPHRSHVYQRLVQAGWSPGGSVLFFALRATALSVTGLAWLTSNLSLILVGSTAAAGFSVLYAAAPSIFTAASAP
jgi:UDP-N-acetylmuramyl pentapeptide phosphotransferase/UDP-N-acetylglucosamine-1-phosphate transferase